MTLDQIISDAYLPALALIGVADSRPARVMVLTIGLQESRFKYRRQMGNGPAKSFWQFERGGGVKGVLTHPASKVKALALCAARKVPPEALAVWNAMEFDDVLGAGMCRLLLLTDPKPLPAVDDAPRAWDYYLRTWRPGKPHRATWDDLHAQAVAATV